VRTSKRCLVCGRICVDPANTTYVRNEWLRRLVGCLAGGHILLDLLAGRFTSLCEMVARVARELRLTGKSDQPPRRRPSPRRWAHLHRVDQRRGVRGRALRRGRHTRRNGPRRCGGHVIGTGGQRHPRVGAVAWRGRVRRLERSGMSAKAVTALRTLAEGTYILTPRQWLAAKPQLDD
jgi:hypothetical protein